MKYRAGATITNGAGETPLHIAARYITILLLRQVLLGVGHTLINQVPYYTTHISQVL